LYHKYTSHICLIGVILSKDNDILTIKF